jgi:regulator of protease activity HflC (stomatin/prohibitin superfamily)
MLHLYAMITTIFRAIRRRHPVKRLESLLNSRAFLIFFPLTILFLWGFFVGPIHGLLNQFVLAGLIGVAIVFAIAGLFFLFTLWLIGPHVVLTHPRDRYERSGARRVLRHFALGSTTLTAVVREGVVLDGPHSKPRAQADGEGVIDVDSTSVVALATDTERLSRIKGPGLIFTHEDEKIAAVIDLRRQSRADDFECTTRDGIPVHVRISVRFQVDQTQFLKVQELTSALKYPPPVVWSQRTIQRILKLQIVGQTGNVVKWDDIPLDVAKGGMRGIVAEYTFDGLSEPQEPTKNPREHIRSRLEQTVRRTLTPFGINLLGLSIGVFLPKDYDPETSQLDATTQQRIKSWQAEWQSRMIRARATAEAESDRKHQVARTQAQMELITRVTQALEQDSPVPTDNPDQIAQHFLDTLQKMATEPYTRAESRRLFRLALSEQMESDEPSPSIDLE